MSAKQNYYPTRHGDKITWHLTQRKATNWFATLLTPAADGASYLADNERILHGLQIWRPAVSTFDQSGSQYLTLLLDGPAGPAVLVYPGFNPPVLPAEPPAVLAGALKRMFGFIGSAKKSSRCNDILIADLSWAGPAELPPDPTTTQPVLRVEHTTSGKANLRWVKGPFDGLIIEVNRAGAGWVSLEIDLRPDFLDNWLPATGQTAVVQYRGQYLYKGEPFGLKGLSASITLTGE